MVAAFILIPLLSAFLGWLIIRLSFLLLFRPVRPLKFASLTIQGALYKNEGAWRSALATLIANEMNAEALIMKAMETSTQTPAGADDEYAYSMIHEGKTYSLNVNDSKESMFLVRMITKSCR